MQPSCFDVIIVGGGLAGLTLACALAQQTSLHIAVLEKKSFTRTELFHDYHPRVSAISLASQRIFQSLQVWSAISKKRISPFRGMHVWDGLHQGELHFDSAEIAQAQLGFIIENEVMQAALTERMHHYPQIEWFCPIELMDVTVTTEGATLSVADGRLLQAPLLVAADGAHSWLREQVGLPVHKKDYAEEALVATVHTTEPHHQIARQIFLATGPLAFLPLADPHFSSIVWTLPVEYAQQRCTIEEKDFNHLVTKAFAERLGQVTLRGKRYTFPLYQQQVTRYIAPHVALIGDAVHTVHPLAGQGLNISLLDAVALAEVVTDAVQKNRAFSSVATLRRYERWRKADNQLMLEAIDRIHTLFNTDKRSLQHLRSWGLQMVNHSVWLKKLFMTYAVGARAT